MLGRAAVLAALEAGPATAAELATKLGCTVHNIVAHLRAMEGYEVEKTGDVVKTEGRRGRAPGLWDRKSPPIPRPPRSSAATNGYAQKQAMRRLLVDLGAEPDILAAGKSLATPIPGLVRWTATCATCSDAGDGHQCCPGCEIRADGPALVERVFGFRTMRGETRPQPRCKRCR